MKMIELENILSYPDDIVDILNKNKKQYFKNNELPKEILLEINNLLKKYYFVVYHFTKIVNEEDYKENGILTHKKWKNLLNIVVNNLRSSNSFLESEIDDIQNQLFNFERSNVSKNIFYSYTKNDIIKNKDLQGTLTKFYGGEYLCNLFLGKYDKKLQKIGKSAMIKFYIPFNSKDIYLSSKIAEYYYQSDTENYSFSGYEGQLEEDVKKEEILDIFYLSDLCNSERTRKICLNCLIEKDITEFSKDNRYNYKDKYVATCKKCKYKKTNKDKAKIYAKKYRDTHKQEEKLRQHEYYLKNKEEINKKHLIYRNHNKDKIKKHYYDNYDEIRARQKKYNEKNKDKINSKNREYYYNNIEKFREKGKKYREEHKDYLRDYLREYERKRRQDSLEKFKDNVRSLIYNSLRRKNYSKSQKTEEILGCNLDYFRNYIEAKFIDGMCWENLNEIHIDHIVPLATATSEEEVIKLCHYTNLQPLWSTDNLSKGAKVDWKKS